MASASSQETLLYIHLLGQPYFFWNGRPLRFVAPPRALPLLAYVLVHRDRPVERLYLSSLLWPDEPEADARANLRRHLHHLHNFFPALPSARPWLLTDELTVQWNQATPYQFDVAEFERLGCAPTTWIDALSHYHGDFLETVYDDWVLVERERLREQYLNLLMQMALDCRARCDYAQASLYTGQLLARDVLREDVLRLHIALRYQAGDRAGAIQGYEKFQRLLRQELDVEPMPETQAIADAILRNRPLPVTGPVIAGATTHQARSPLLPFVGRQAQIAQLEAAWQDACNGVGRIWWVSGEAGIGKTRLAREFAQWVELRGGRVLYGNTLPVETVPYQALREALSMALPLFAFDDLAPVWLAALAAMLPELSQQSKQPLPVLPDLDDKNQRTRLFEAVWQTLSALARPRPMVLILEDLHWAGAGTFALLEYLAHQVNDAALFILVTYRDEEVEREHPLSRLRYRLQKSGRSEHLALNRFSSNVIEDLLHSLPTTGNENLAVSLSAAQLQTQSAGIPLFLEWQLRQPMGERTERIDPQAASQVVFADLDTVLRRRLRQLPASALALAEVAAVAGPAFEFDLVRTVGGWGEGQAFDALGKLLDHRLVCESPGHSRFDYIFDHYLIQTAIYHEIPPEVLRRRHHRMAQAMEKRYSQQLDVFAGEIGGHYELGGETTSAVDYYLRALRHCLTLYADNDALSYAIRALPLANEPRLRFEIFAQREAIYSRTGEHALQRADLDEMIQLVKLFHDPELVCEVLRRRILYHRALSERSLEAALLDELRAQVEQMDNIHWQAVSFFEEAIYLILSGQLDECKASLIAALENYRLCGDIAGQVACYSQLGSQAIRAGKYDEILSWASQAKKLVEDQENINLRVKVLSLEQQAAYTHGDYVKAYDTCQQALMLVRKIGDRNGELNVLLSLASSASRLLHVGEAYQYYSQCELLSIRLGNREIQAGNYVNRGVFCERLGRIDDAIVAHQKALETFQALGNVYGQMLCFLNLGNSLTVREDYRLAESYLLQALVLTDKDKGSRARTLGALGTVERELGKLEESLIHIQEGLAIRHALNLGLEWNLSELALTYLRMNSLVEAQKAAEQAVSLWGNNNGPKLHYQKDLWVLARVYQALGKWECARESVSQAYRVMEELAGDISEAEAKSAFLRILYNRQIAAAYERDEWPPE